MQRWRGKEFESYDNTREGNKRIQLGKHQQGTAGVAAPRVYLKVRVVGAEPAAKGKYRCLPNVF